MRQKHIDKEYSAEDYRGFINFLLDRIEDIMILRRILDIVNDIFCRN